MCLPIEIVEAKCNKVSHYYVKSIDYAGKYVISLLCCVCKLVCVYMCLYVCVYICVHTYTCICVPSVCVHLYIYIHVCYVCVSMSMFMCAGVCVCVCTYIYVYDLFVYNNFYGVYMHTYWSVCSYLSLCNYNVSV